MTQDGHCEICNRHEGVALYRYYPPALSRFADSRPASVAFDRQYSSEHSVAVTLCRRCVRGKHRRALSLYGAGMLVSIPLVSVGIGAIGVLYFGWHLWRLRSSQEVGDIIAINWRESRRHSIATPYSAFLTRRAWERLPNKRIVPHGTPPTWR